MEIFEIINLCPALDSVMVLEGSGVSTPHTPLEWVEGEKFEPVSSEPIFMVPDKTPPPGTLSRVSS